MTYPPAPSPELADRIQQLINELPTESDSNWLQRACKRLNALPLHGNLNFLWALLPNGNVVSIDHEAFSLPTEPETDPMTVYAVLANGARRHPELTEIIPPRPRGVRQCELCNGSGWINPPIPGGSNFCVRCNGLGWYSSEISSRPSKSYCNEPLNQGLTCLRDNLVLLRRLSEDEGPASTNIVLLYQCKSCKGLYKYIYSSSYQARSFDAEEGWVVYCDTYFKAGGRNNAGSLMFPLEEAHIYGFQDDELSP
jgi:hypothetical protein